MRAAHALKMANQDLSAAEREHAAALIDLEAIEARDASHVTVSVSQPKE
jgi:hypothetical protein